MGVTVGDFLGCRRAHCFDGDVEHQHLTRQRMVGIDVNLLVFHFDDANDLPSLWPIGLKNHARR